MTLPKDREPVLKAKSNAKFSGIDADIMLGGPNSPFSVINISVAKGLGAPAHISIKEDKIFHVTSGLILFQIGEEKVDVGAGDYIFVEKGEIHSFSGLSDSDATMVLVSTPSLHDKFFDELAALPVPHALEDIQSVCKNCHQEIVGPVVTRG